MDVSNVQLSNLVYQGGDDCIAIKPRSYNVDIRNVTCVGGNGIAIGSLGQYLEDNSVANILVDNVTVYLLRAYQSIFFCGSNHSELLIRSSDTTRTCITAHISKPGLEP